ncbi:hypothetical protein [Silvanigrella aquatica]|uniref:Uncharacterized protein n=1 Tax=Silvanigrella aquatica TaxID=1915309 RepID=A0A1L4CYQ1_9BACT|nr:hypothetical protein [Silvanigrella aquatica]APJ03081.1 hypothetical protein AXG55_03815 [Silvanigrella aquatica]
MPPRSSRLSKWSIYIIISSLILLCLIMIFLSIISFYPIQSVTANFNNAHFSRLIAPWPMSALEQELLERRKLRRYAKAEQMRRMEKQLQRMENLNIPIYDLFLDANAEISNSRYITAPDDTSFLWPVLPGRKVFYNPNNPNFIRKSSSVIFPSYHWSSISEGVLLLGGEEIKATIPVVKGRRSFSFNLFLLSPGSIRINLGQYVWAKSFTDDDVQKRIKISIPINDSTAASIRIMSVSSSFYILNANVNHIDHTGRSPIRVSNSSQFWMPNKSLIITNPKKENINSNDDNNDNDEFDDDKIPDEIKPEEVLQNHPQNNIKSQAKKTEETVQDPLKQSSNPQLITNDSYTTAFGYNILYIQTPKISENILKNKKIFNHIAPSLSSIMDQSVIFSKSISISDNTSENFRKFIFSDHNFLNSENIFISKEEINEYKSKNIYQELRKYGYNIVGISHPESYYFNKNISDSSEFTSIYGRWLERNDWTFAKKNIQIDDRNIPASGLDAIFKTNPKGIAAPLTAKDFPIISKYLGNVAQNIDNVPDWGTNEFLLINNQDLYIPRVIEAFQNWTSENQQSRFLAHILLDTETNLIRPTLKDLGKSITTLGFSSIVNPLKIDELATVSYIDRAIGQIIDTIKARKIEHRTIIFVLIPVEKNDGKKSFLATGIFKIPGLIPKMSLNFENININDISATLLSTVGIPIGRNILSNNNDITGIMLEKTTPNEYQALKQNMIPRKNNYIKYTMSIKPDENNCSPFYWTANSDSIFSVHSNFPIYQLISNNLIEFFPCSIKNKYINLSWYQKNENKLENNSNIEGILGGSFQYKRSLTPLPHFYFGKNFVPSDSISFYFDSMTSNNVEEIFSVDEKNSKKCQKQLKDSFSAIDTFESKNIEDPSLSKKTKVGFFITPL